MEAGDDLGEAYEVEVRQAERHRGRTSPWTRTSTWSARTSTTTTTPDADDRALGASERTSAERAALNAVNGGTVTEVEAGDDPGEAYEVEVRAGNTEWDVELAADFTVVRKTVDD